MKARDPNDILRADGADALRAAADNAKAFHLDENACHKEAKGQSERQELPCEGVSLDDFYAYLPQHQYIFAPTRDLWPAASVNARLSPVAVEQMTWAPGMPVLIPDKLIANGGWISRPGCAVFNLYRPPTSGLAPGDVTPWLDLVERNFPDQAEHIVSWLAQRVQRPHEKINHALVLGGEPGIGKDTILEPIKQAIGPWNFADVSPKQVLGRFNGFLKSVVLRISEARDLGEFDRYAFHDHMKIHIASPPDVLRVDEKNLREHYIFNLCGVIITTNHKTDGIYLPADDRRHMVAWSNLTKDDFPGDYWRKIYEWYANGGNQYVADYLENLDISAFDPKEPPPKTQAFWEIVNANRAPEDAELADVLDDLGRPDVITLTEVTSRAAVIQPAFAGWLNDRRNRRSIPHRFEDCGYVAVSNPSDTSGRWKIGGTRYTIYGKAALTVQERLAAAFKSAGARGRTETVYLAWAECGVLGNRTRFLCPRCRRCVCLLYYLDGRLYCRRCSGLWYAAQRISAKARKFRSMKMIRRKLGDYGQLWATKVPPKPRGMWRRTYARHCASLARIERSLYLPRRLY